MHDKKEFYQYRSLTKLEHLSHLNNYIKQKLWFTRLSDFKDPFEANFFYKPVTAKKILDSEQLFGCPELTKDFLENELMKPEADEMLGKLQFKNDFFQSHGAICFTFDPSNIPMWAHYASEHKGYCVVFEIDLDFIYQKYKSGYDETRQSNYDSENYDQEILSFKSDLDSDKHFIFTKIIYQGSIPLFSVNSTDTASRDLLRVDENSPVSSDSYVKLEELAGLAASSVSKVAALRVLGKSSSTCCVLVDGKPELSELDAICWRSHSTIAV